MSQETTTIEITRQQKEDLTRMGFGSYKAALQELIENYDDGTKASLTDAQRGEVREIALDVVSDRVIREALE